MNPGDVIEVLDATGGQYEAVARWRVSPNTWRCEWIAGPNDGDQVVVVMEEH